MTKRQALGEHTPAKRARTEVQDTPEKEVGDDSDAVHFFRTCQVRVSRLYERCNSFLLSRHA